jgi:predicted nucleic acid-binding protein
VTDAPAAFVDTNVLFDIATRDPTWARWSVRALDRAALAGPLVINDVVYSELSARFGTIEAVDAFVDAAALRVERAPREALFVAAKAFVRYRSLGGARTSPLPDFFIGAQAAVASAPLITRDARRYRTYFSTLVLITP